jgi:hypothetical protein
MSAIRPLRATALVVGACAAIGAGAGILGSASASSGPASTTGAAPTSAATSPAGAGAGAGARAGRRSGLRRLLRSVHTQAVIPVAGGSFATVTLDRGTVESVSGQQLTLREGTKTATYATVTLTIPIDAVVRDNRQSASLSSLTAGQTALVLSSPRGTHVLARTPRG